MKKNIALIAGGYSGEFVISIASAKTIAKHLDVERFAVYQIIIDRSGWFYQGEGGDKTAVDKNDFSIIDQGQKVRFDAAFIAIHGSPGEDGRLQGYLDMLQIPYTTCNSIVSALTFNKNFCNKVVKEYDVVRISKSVVLYKNSPYSLGSILEQLQLPVFVKPNESGSSLGISKVTAPEQILPAIEMAFREDSQVMIEEFIEGRELTIGVYKLKDTIFVLPPTEIVSKNAFFDYEAKYTAGITNEITPAPISAEILQVLNKKSKAIYACLHCAGMVRMDFILQNKSNELYFLEVNTMPGQSEASLIPQQVAAAGMELRTFYGNLLDEIL
jgi:D-alanine-D-alanine ligase